jgi:holo-[acyl-carrier protein] synthase
MFSIRAVPVNLRHPSKVQRRPRQTPGLWSLARAVATGYGKREPMYTGSMPLPPGEFAPPRDEMVESTAIVVGTDLVQVSEVSKAMERFGERYLRRLFTEAELSYCLESAEVAPSRLAARFAAKEAALKVLRLTDQSFSWRSIEVARNPGGWCYLVLHGPMRASPMKPDSWLSR